MKVANMKLALYVYAPKSAQEHPACSRSRVVGGEGRGRPISVCRAHRPTGGRGNFTVCSLCFPRIPISNTSRSSLLYCYPVFSVGSVYEHGKEIGTLSLSVSLSLSLCLSLSLSFCFSFSLSVSLSLSYPIRTFFHSFPSVMARNITLALVLLMTGFLLVSGDTERFYRWRNEEFCKLFSIFCWCYLNFGVWNVFVVIVVLLLFAASFVIQPKEQMSVSVY